MMEVILSARLSRQLDAARFIERRCQGPPPPLLDDASTALFKKREFHTRAGERVRLILTKRKVRTFSVEPGIMQMRNKLTFTPQQSSVYDYSASVAKAVEWLGDRYLLAKPINASPGRSTAAATRN